MTNPTDQALLRAGLRLFTVEGIGEFPWDMLRYDNCFPVSYEDWLATTARYEDHSGADVEKSDVEARLGRRQVRLATRSSGFTVPTIGRWESFNWRVVERGR